MVRALHDNDCPEPWLKKKKPVATTTRETRTSVKANARNEKVSVPVPSRLLSGSGQGCGRKG